MEFDFFVYHDNFKKILSISPVEQSGYNYPYVKIPYSQVQTYLEGKEKLSEANLIFYNSRPYLVNQNFVLDINPHIEEFKKVQSNPISVLNISLNSFGELLLELNVSRIKNLDENFPNVSISFYITPLDDHDILYQNSFDINELIQSRKIGFKIPKGLELDQIDIWITNVFALYRIDILEKHNNVELSGLYDCQYNKDQITFCANYSPEGNWLEIIKSSSDTHIPIYCCKNSDPTIVYETVILSNGTKIQSQKYNFYSFDNNVRYAGGFRIFDKFKMLKKSQLTSQPLTVLVTKHQDTSVVYKTQQVDKNTKLSRSWDYFSNKIPIN